ncbi:hypothetical protein N9Z98_01900 [Akkermansiaceae bacterium]|nr:hypothetical protein [Akkermansiaceae bacterium]
MAFDPALPKLQEVASISSPNEGFPPRRCPQAPHPISLFLAANIKSTDSSYPAPSAIGLSTFSKIETAVEFASAAFVNETMYALAFENSPMASRRSMSIFMAATQAYLDSSQNPKSTTIIGLNKIGCHFSCYSNAPLTAAISGTSESVIFSNYHSMIKKTEASKLWEIQP